MNKKILFFFLTILFATTLKAQSVKVDCNNEPLNRVFLTLRNQYNMRFSYDDELLSHYKITVHQTFSSDTNAIRFLIKDFPLGMEINEHVFVIFPSAEKENKTNTCLITGYILERNSNEPLPYSHIIINETALASDVSGFFSGKIRTDTVYHIRASHLGYYILDTTIAACKETVIYLTPGTVQLKQVEIKGSLIEYRSQTGAQPGLIKLNSKIAEHLPGYGDNSVFNLLRLQPGILASGEQTNELIIWGSYSGQTKVMFDGFTVYGLKNFNDNISAFNPLMAKDIEILKGGYDARYGERVGGIVNITGKNGNTRNFSFTFNVNNMTVNTLAEIPVGKRSSFVIAFRHTYFNLYNPTDFTKTTTDPSGNQNSIDIHVVPDYVFRDINLKYSGITKSGDLYYVSLYSGEDRFKYNIDQQIKFRQIQKETSESNRQFGGSLFYGKKWKNGWTENFSLSSSSLKEQYYDHYQIEKLWDHTFDTLNWESVNNRMTELHLRTDLTSPLNTVHTLEWGGGLIGNQSHLVQDTFNIVNSIVDMTGTRLYLYFQDKIKPGKHLSFRAGGRLNYAVNLKKYYAEPRLSAIYTVNDDWRITFATGIYNQFITKTSVLDNQGNFRYLWAICDNRDIPVLTGIHNVLGVSFFKNNWTFSMESYYKLTYGLSRFVRYRNIIAPGIYHGKSRSYGMDLMLKKEYKGNSAWIAYSLSKTEEHFDYFPDNKYRRAPQDQRQEIKLAVLINLNPFYVSANYVYGTGFPITYYQQQRLQPDYPYSRLDGAVSYRFLNKKVKAEAGISILNILNHENIKFANFERIPINQTAGINIYAQAIPFTPTLYLNISL